MPKNHIAEATVHVLADVTGFKTDLDTKLDTALQKYTKLVSVTAVVDKVTLAKNLKPVVVPAVANVTGVAGAAGAGAGAAGAGAAQKAGAAAAARSMNVYERSIESTTRQLKLLSIAEETRATTAQEASGRVAAAKRLETRSILEAREAQLAIQTATTQAEIKQAEAAERAALANQRLAASIRESNLTLANQDVVAAKTSKSIGQAARGAGGAGLAFLGLRGAMLAATGPFLAASAAMLAIGKAISNAASFERQLDIFRATSAATADQMEQVSEAAKQLGADMTLPSVSANDAAEAMTELTKAGLSVQDSIGGARGVLQLATAASIDNAQATEIAADALNAYGLAGMEAAHVADVFTNAANASQGSIVDIGVAFKQVAAVARQVGISFEDTSALLTLLAKNGMRGSDAGTSLRTALLRLVSPTERAAGWIETLDLKLRDLQGNVRPDVFAQFGEATKNLSPDMRDMIATIIFGQDAIRAVNIAAREGTSGLAEAQDNLARVGSAAEFSAAKTEGLAGKVDGLKSNLETLGTTLGTIVIPALSEFVDGLNKVVQAASTLSETLIKIGNWKVPVIDTTGFEVAVDRIKEGMKVIVAAATFGMSEKLFAAYDLWQRMFAPSEQEKLDAFARSGTALATVYLNLAAAITTVSDALLGLQDPFAGREDQAARTKAAIQQGQVQLKQLEADLRLGLRSFGEVRPEARKSVKAAISRTMLELSKTEAGMDILKKYGKKLGLVFGNEIAAGVKESEAVTSAREALQEAVVSARQAVVDSVRSARSNLQSMGESLAQMAADVVEAKFKITIDKIDAQISKLQDSINRRRLKLSLFEAETDLRDAERRYTQFYAGLGQLSAQQIASREKTLRPLREKVLDVKAEGKISALEVRKTKLEETRDAAKTAAEEGVLKLVEAFQKGRISAQKLAQKLSANLRPQLEFLKNNGKNMGITFTSTFFDTLDKLVAQAQVLTGFMGMADTAPGGTVENPATKVAEGKAQIARAQKNLDAAIQAQKDTATNTKTMNTKQDRVIELLAKIAGEKPGNGGNGRNGLGGTGKPAQSRMATESSTSVSVP